MKLGQRPWTHQCACECPAVLGGTQLLQKMFLYSVSQQHQALDSGAQGTTGLLQMMSAEKNSPIFSMDYKVPARICLGQTARRMKGSLDPLQPVLSATASKKRKGLM